MLGRAPFRRRRARSHARARWRPAGNLWPRESLRLRLLVREAAEVVAPAAHGIEGAGAHCGDLVGAEVAGLAVLERQVLELAEAGDADGALDGLLDAAAYHGVAVAAHEGGRALAEGGGEGVAELGRRDQARGL